MITRDEAAAIARARAEERGWGLREPIAINGRKTWSGQVRKWKVESDPTMRGTKSWFEIDAATGAIVGEGYIPR